MPVETVSAIRHRMGTSEKVTIRVYPGAEHRFNRYGYQSYHEAAAGVVRHTHWRISASCFASARKGVRHVGQ
jgi:dienelactone hydrolase